MKLKILSLAAVWLLLTQVTGYAQNSRAGADSNASLRISLAIVPTLAIDTVSSISVNIADRSVDAEFSRQFCVQGSSMGKYTVTAYGTNDADSFFLVNETAEPLAYQVFYRGASNTQGFEQLSAAIPSRAYDVIAPQLSCSEDLSAFSVQFRSTDLTAVGSGLYSGALTLLISPV
jgi:hypothetical protein